MKRWMTLLLLTLSLPAMAGDLVVIVHPDNPVNALKPTMVARLFMGKADAFPDQSPVQPVQLANSPLRVRFDADVLRKTPAQLRAYWARMLFSGRAAPPKEMPDEATLRQHVAAHREAIGYLDAHSVDASVKVVTRIPDGG